jgi:hypothetical protein
MKSDDCSVAKGFPVTVSGLAKVANFTTNVDAENQCSINHKRRVPLQRFLQNIYAAGGDWSGKEKKI